MNWQVDALKMTPQARNGTFKGSRLYPILNKNWPFQYFGNKA